jgi:hypothetical protein
MGRRRTHQWNRWQVSSDLSAMIWSAGVASTSVLVHTTSPVSFAQTSSCRTTPNISWLLVLGFALLPCNPMVPPDGDAPELQKKMLIKLLIKVNNWTFIVGWILLPATILSPHLSFFLFFSWLMLYFFSFSAARTDAIYCQLNSRVSFGNFGSFFVHGQPRNYYLLA